MSATDLIRSNELMMKALASTTWTAAIQVAKPLVSSMGLEPLARRVLGKPATPPVGHTAEALAFIASSVTASTGPTLNAPELGGIDGVAPLVPQLLSHGETETAEQLISVLVEHVCEDTPPARPATPQGEAALLTALLAGIGRVPRARDALLRRLSAVATMLHRDATGYADHPCVLVAARRCGNVVSEGYLELIDQRITALVRRVSSRLQPLRRARFAIIEGFIDAMHHDLAGALFDARMKWPVAIRELPDAATCAYRLGRWEEGDRALERLEQQQAPGLDNLDTTFAARYLRANRYRVGAFFDRIAPELPSHVPPDDGRAEVVLERVSPGARVLEVGCGKARFLKAVQERRPDVTCTGVDLSPTLLASAPAAVHTAAGALESIPCRTNAFDTVFSVEAIEHSSNWRASVRELIRVTRPGGWLLIIDKPKSAWGKLPCPAWERWPSSGELAGLMQEGCDDVDAVNVPYDGRPADGLITAWRGRKRLCPTPA
jgi:SAM-dependent methyltransferase